MPISSNIRILRWEAGETAPTGTRIVELAKILQVEPESLVSENKPVSQAVPNSNALVFEKGELRIKLPATEKGYELFNRLVERITG